MTVGTTQTLMDTPAANIGELLDLGQPAPYMFLLMVLSLVAVALVWRLLNVLLSSPWGRVLKAIREDEEVAQHHGHDVLTHKAASLALGAAIAGLAGAFWAWKLTGFEPTFMSPARSTFLVWAAFVIGGRSNNRGMVVGAFIIVLMEFVFNVLVAAQGSPDLPLYTTADRIDSLVRMASYKPVGGLSYIRPYRTVGPGDQDGEAHRHRRIGCRYLRIHCDCTRPEVNR